MANMSSGRFSVGSPALTLFVLVLAETIISLDFSLVSIALPSIERSLGISSVTAQWILTVDIIIYGGFMIVGGRFADRHGERHCLTIGLSLFLLGSLVNALSWRLEAMLVGRAIQGLGAAFTFPATVGLLAKTFEVGPSRFRALTISTAVQATGVPLGTMAAGFLAAKFGGNAAFSLNVPICILLLILVRRALPKATGSKEAKRLPVISGIILATGMGLFLQSALGIVATDPNTRRLALYAFPASIAVLSLFFAIQRRSANPLFPLSLFRIQNLGIYILATAALVTASKGLIVLSNISFQQGLGFTSWQASLALIPMAVSSVLLVFVTPFLSAPLLRNPRVSMIAAFLLIALMHATLSQVPGTIAAMVLLTLLFMHPYISVTGTNIGVSEILARAPVENHGVVAAMLYTTNQIIGGLGLALMIAARDRSPEIVDDFTRFTPGFLVAMTTALTGASLLFLATKPFLWQPGKRRSKTTIPSR